MVRVAGLQFQLYEQQQSRASIALRIGSTRTRDVRVGYARRLLVCCLFPSCVRYQQLLIQ